jgi:high-affinity iron transporter
MHGGIRHIFINKIIKISSITLVSLSLFLLITISSFASSNEKRILSLVDYIGGDYQNAVKNGEVINDGEYNEMLEFSTETKELFETLKSSEGDKANIESEIYELSNLIVSKASVQDVEGVSNKIKEKIISSYGIVSYPEKKPSLEVGQELYANNCSQCHGMSGAGDGSLAQGLNPPPTVLIDPDFYSGLSPFKVHNTMSFGIKGTAMPAFPQITDDKKWDVAFYVMSLGATNKNSDSGKEIAATLTNEIKDYKNLAVLSNNQILDKTNSNVSEEDNEFVISYLRKGMFDSSTGSVGSAIAMTSALLNDSLKLYKAGNKKESYEKTLDAYILGFEQVEPDLFVKDRKFKTEVEANFADYRNAIKSGKSVKEIENLHIKLQDNLNSASVILESESSGKYLSFLNSFAIMVREGLEAILIIAAIIAFLSATGSRKSIKYIHYGWIAALGAGLLTWFLAKTVISISGAQREIIEGITALTAAAVLFYVSYWLITKIEVKKWKQYIQGKVESAVSRNSVIALVSVSFFAVYREAFETVLFYQALWYQAENSQSAVIWGIIAGGAVLVVLYFVIFKMALRIPIKYFFTFTSIFLYLLAFILLGKGIKELQAAGAVSVTPVDYLPYIDVIGFYPTLETSVPQAILVLAFAFAVFWLGYIKREKEKKELAVTVSQISEDLKSMQAAFSHIKGHIIEWKKCQDIDLEAEDLDNQIQEVVSHVDELESKLGDFYDVVSKNTETFPKKVH